MPKQTVYSVHQRSTVNSTLERELGMFTDDAMADQAIQHLYRYAWQEILKGTASITWFNSFEAGSIKSKGFDVWAVDDMNTATPIFFKRWHNLWNQVPPNAAEFRFTQEEVFGAHVAVEEVKKLF